MNAELVPARTLVSDVLILIKFRIGSMVVLGTFVGYVLGIGQAIDPISIFHVLFATFLTASGTGVLNQFMERERDGLMGRTADRPLLPGASRQRWPVGSGLFCVEWALSISGCWSMI